MKYKYFPDVIFRAVEKVEIIRETDKCFFVPTRSGERMVKKQSRNGQYFDTFDEAKSYLIKALENRVESYRGSLKESREGLKKVKLMEEGK